MVIAVRSAAARAEHTLEPRGTRAIVTERLRSIDIDTPEDFRIAEAIADELR
jgi:CMP-N-acetylneuraminic acid synthetase